MLRTPGTDTRVAVELWELPLAGVVTVLRNEPSALAIGKAIREDDAVALGVLGEPLLREGQREITAFGGRRAYTPAQQGRSAP